MKNNEVVKMEIEVTKDWNVGKLERFVRLFCSDTEDKKIMKEMGFKDRNEMIKAMKEVSPAFIHKVTGR